MPSGYDLEVHDRNDDTSLLNIYTGNTPLASLRMGSIKLISPFRSVKFEGGAVTSNDSGNIQYLRNPSIHTVKSAEGKNTVYISIVSVLSGSFTGSGGTVNIGVRCDSVSVKKFHTEGSAVTICVYCEEPSAWEKELKRSGFSTSYQDGSLKAVSSEVSDVYVTCANIGFEKV